MRGPALLLAVFLGLSSWAHSEGQGFQDPLLDELVGDWVLEGEIAGSNVVHDIDARWVLGHHYLRLEEVARETLPDGRPAYEATVHIGWDRERRQYVCQWLDSTGGGGLVDGAFGYAPREGDTLAFLFFTVDDGIHTTFSYEREEDIWRFTVDLAENGEMRRFAGATLRRAREDDSR